MFLENVVMDAADPQRLGRFWEAVVGGEDGGSEAGEPNPFCAGQDLRPAGHDHPPSAAMRLSPASCDNPGTIGFDVPRDALGL